MFFKILLLTLLTCSIGSVDPERHDRIVPTGNARKYIFVPFSRDYSKYPNHFWTNMKIGNTADPVYKVQVSSYHNATHVDLMIYNDVCKECKGAKEYNAAGK
jgi:hypothetical protein